MQNETNKLRLPKGNLSLTGFTLLELVIVIVIIGILATLGYNQYSLIVEKSRTAEAIARIGVARQSASEYYLKNGSLTGIQPIDLFDYDDPNCLPTKFFYYYIGVDLTGTYILISAARCTSGGKTPNATRQYVYYLRYEPATNKSEWKCIYPDDASSCFGLPAF
jgi:type IV pilus assembly protein PilE